MSEARLTARVQRNHVDFRKDCFHAHSEPLANRQDASLPIRLQHLLPIPLRVPECRTGVRSRATSSYTARVCVVSSLSANETLIRLRSA